MKKRVIALALCLVMLATCLGAGIQAPTPVKLVDENGAAATSAAVPQLGRKTLTASYADATETTGYQWQFSNDGDTWINIYGETAQTCSLSYAKVKNMLDADGEAQLRCVVTDGEDERVSSAATVTVDYSAQTAEAQSEGLEKAAPARAASYTRSAAPLNADAPATYNVVINYLFENNAVAADPYTANLAAGSNFSASVTFPTVQGYLPYVNDERQDSIDLNYTAIDEDYTINVVYKPTNVNYTVIHYQQNLNDDNYTEAARETKQGLTNSTVPEVAKSYEGFYALLYEKPAIAADGSTVVEIYYDRYYYLMNFDLDGGYGVEPIYARFGAPISVGTPTKAGYSFGGWELNGTTVVNLPEAMPAENRTYKAVWTSNASAKVTIVFWGENADDEEYSYIRSMQVDATPGESYSYDGSALTCPLAEHSHSTSNCELNCTHVHTLDCYSTSNDFVETSKPSESLTNQGNGIYTYTTTNGWFVSTTHYYLNIGGDWYCGTNWLGDKDNTNKISFDCKHTHTDACYSCGLTEHTHSSACSGLWTFKRSDTVTVAADGSTVVNVYYDRTTFTLTFKANNNTVATITDKWGADISGEFNKAPFNTTYNGRAWKCTDTSKYSYALQTLDRMPQFDATFNLYNKSSDTLKTIYYYVENVGANVSENTWPSNTTNFTLLKTVQTYFNYATYNEEYHEIAGFTRYSASIAGFNNNQKNFSSNNTLSLYYLRNDYTLKFNDGYNDVKTEEVQYQAPLSAYSSYVPVVPSVYEPGSVTFGGWYLNPECTGAEYKLDEHTMPLGNLILYAKWVPVTHTVEFYLNKDALDAGTKLSTHHDITVSHGSKAEPTPADPTNGNYTFVGWFYMENGMEKAFDFANMPVNKDMQVYGKWSSNVLKSYFIYYKIQGTDTEIAAPTIGSGLAGVTKTFEAKGGSDLYADYQEGYFPVTKSHSLTLDIDNNANNVYTFWYVQKEAVPYTVKYLNKETGESVATEKTVSDNRKAVVTETFKPVSGMMPDAYQKRLVVSAEEGAVNEIIFYYTQDTTHAYYKITHYTENLAKDSQGNRTWTEYASSQAVGDIGTTYNADPMTIPGFTYDRTVEGTVAGGELTANGLELKLYYTRNSYPYQVRYLEQGTGKQLTDPKNATGKYGQVVSESAKDIENYDAVAPTSQTLNIRIEEGTEVKLNIITFYYTEKEVTINYQVVGPTGCGTVTPASETLKVLNGTAQGSTAAVSSDTYRFVGWYSDEACTQPVDSSWVDANNKLTPVKAENAAWTAVTYYAKFEYNLTDLTITKTATPYDANDMFIFTVKDSAGKEVAKVALTAGESVTIKNLTVGETYTVTEDTGWSWRYSPDEATHSIMLKPSDNVVTVTNTLVNNNWLGASSYAINRCVKNIATDVFEIVKNIFGN